MSKKAWIFQGGWDGHEPKLTSKRFADMLIKNGFSGVIFQYYNPATTVDGEKEVV